MPASVSQIALAYDAGQSNYATWRKVPTQTTGNGIWFDLSMSSGNPIPNYYVGTELTSTPLYKSEKWGINHGPDVSPYVKYLHKFTALAITPATVVPLPIILCDYLLYYPFVDMSVVEEQPLINTEALPRYADGVDVKVMAVEVAPQVGGSQFYITYTNSAGVSGRISRTCTCNTQAVNGTIITSAPATAGCYGPFIPLMDGDTGVRSIESITFLTGDVGLIALVLVKPLASHQLLDITAPVEKDFIIDHNSCPRIYDDAYLNMICHPTGTLAAAGMNGDITTFWTES